MMFSLTQSCTEKLLSWIEAEKRYDENALLYAYSFLEQFMTDHGLILSHDEIILKIERYLSSIDNKDYKLLAHIEDTLELLIEVMNTNKLLISSQFKMLKKPLY